MSSLLGEDYNAINYDPNYFVRLELDLPKGSLGVELEKKNKSYIVVEIYKKSKVKNKLKIGDEIFSFNEIMLENKTIDEVEALFYKNIISDRKIVIFR